MKSRLMAMGAFGACFAALALAPQAGAAPGDLDPNYGNRGIASVDLGESNEWLAEGAVDSSGKFEGELFRGYVIEDRDIYLERYGLGLARFNDAGALDQSFGSGGTILRPVEDYFSNPGGFGLLPDDSAIAGLKRDYQRIHPDGSIDWSAANTQISSDLEVLPDGGFLLGGTGYWHGGTEDDSSSVPPCQ